MHLWGDIKNGSFYLEWRAIRKADYTYIAVIIQTYVKICQSPELYACRFIVDIKETYS